MCHPPSDNWVVPVSPHFQQWELLDAAHNSGRDRGEPYSVYSHAIIVAQELPNVAVKSASKMLTWRVYFLYFYFSMF